MWLVDLTLTKSTNLAPKDRRSPDTLGIKRLWGGGASLDVFDFNSLRTIALHISMISSGEDRDT